MEIRLRDTGAVVSDSQFRDAYPNISFPALLDAATLDTYGADPVLNGPQPDASRYQIIARDGVEEINGKWFTKFTAIDMSDDARAALDAQQAASQRAERNRRLSESDWTQVLDAPVNQAAWATYRQSLRDITTQTGFPWEVSWPEMPLP